MNIVRARDEVDFECMMTRAMEGDAAVDILTYLPTGEVVNTVLAVRAWYGNAREIQNNMERHGQTSKVRIHKCINKLQETKTTQGCHKVIVVAKRTYKVWKAIISMGESQGYFCYDIDDLGGRSGTVGV